MYLELLSASMFAIPNLLSLLACDPILPRFPHINLRTVLLALCHFQGSVHRKLPAFLGLSMDIEVGAALVLTLVLQHGFG